jgi:hypothetical protein
MYAHMNKWINEEKKKEKLSALVTEGWSAHVDRASLNLCICMVLRNPGSPTQDQTLQGHWGWSSLKGLVHGTHISFIRYNFVNLDSNVLKIENRIGVVAHACNPSLFMRLRSGGLRFEANQKRKKKKVSKIPISTNRFLWSHLHGTHREEDHSLRPTLGKKTQLSEK